MVAVLLATGVLRAKAIPDRPAADRRPIARAEPRVLPLPESQWTSVHRQLVEKYAPAGRADNALKTLLHVPEIVEGAMPLTAYLLNESGLAPRHRYILVLRTAWLCGSASLWATHVPRARDARLSPIEIRRIAEGPDAPGWSAFERSLLRVADQLYRNSSIDEASWNALAANYDVNRRMDAVETVNHFTFLALLYNSFGVQPDKELADRMPTSIPYRVVAREPDPPLAVARLEPGPGQGIAVGRTYARHPALNAPRGMRGTYILNGQTLSPRHREMLILRIGWNCRSEYEWAQHVGSIGRAREHGVDPLLVARGPDGPGIDPFDAAILRVADDVYRDAGVSDRTWTTLARRFDTRMLMTAVYTAASYRAVSMALRAYGVQFEPETRDRFPQVD